MSAFARPRFMDAPSYSKILFVIKGTVIKTTQPIITAMFICKISNATWGIV